MLKKVLLTSGLLAASTGFAGGTGGTEVALASYSGIGVTAAMGLPLDIKFLSSNGLNSYGEVELAAGFGDGVALGAEVAGGLVFALDRGLSAYASLGPAIGLSDDSVDFGLGAEIGLNVDINDTAFFIEGGIHPASNYIAVGLKL